MSPKTKLLLLLLVMASPLVASYVAYYFWKPTRSVNYGELLQIRRMPLERLESLGDSGVNGLQGKWVLLSVDSGECGAACTQKLYYMRQVRLAQGKQMDRIARAYVVNDSVTPEVSKEFAGTVLLKGAPAMLADLPDPADAKEHIYLIDPLGNLVLRYPANPDPKRMIKDLTRLLSVSQIG